MSPPFVQYVGLVFICLAVSFSGTNAAEPSVDNGNHDIWRIDSHALAYIPANAETFPLLKFYRWDGSRWEKKDAETFLETQQPDVPIAVLVLGYTSGTSQTTKTGLSMRRFAEPEKKCRLVFWDWFADKTSCRIRWDIWSKMPVAHQSAGYLTFLLQSLKPESRVCLAGFSLGTLVVCDSVQQLETPVAEKLHLHVVLAAAATDWNSLGKNEKHNKVVHNAEKILVAYNPGDWALRYYPLIYRCGNRKEALGRTGPPLRLIDEPYRSRIEAINVQRLTGREHDSLTVAAALAALKKIDEYFFFGETATP